MHVWWAIGSVVAADTAMSIDNILAVAGASHGDIRLIVFGLGVSIPFVIFAGHFIGWLMNRFAWLIYAGSALLGKVGAEMMMTDAVVARLMHPSRMLLYAVQISVMATVLVIGKLISNRKSDVRS